MKTLSAFSKLILTPQKKENPNTNGTPIQFIKEEKQKNKSSSSLSNIKKSVMKVKKPKRKLNPLPVKLSDIKKRHTTNFTSMTLTPDQDSSSDSSPEAYQQFNLEVHDGPQTSFVNNTPAPGSSVCITDKPPSGFNKNTPLKAQKSSSMIIKKNVCLVNCKNIKKLMTPTKMTNTVTENSIEAGREMFKEVISPVDVKVFFKEIWEQKPLLVRRHKEDYNRGWFSFAELERIVKEEHLYYGVNIDVVTYTKGLRETHNPQGRVYSSILWDYYANGCSIRLLNPHSYCHETWRRLSSLQEFVGSMAGANIYLTPQGTQGFAPHWDDIEAFILQLEGRKHWKVYRNRNEAEQLPCYSSENFNENDLQEPVLDVILEAGDLLYFPRGFIHQGRSLPDHHSLHITFSCAQKNTWGELLEKIIPAALQTAFKEDVDFRRSLPTNYMNYMGLVHEDSNSAKRSDFVNTTKKLVGKLLNRLPVDIAVDHKVKAFVHDCLPPCLSECEKQRTIQSDVVTDDKLELYTKIKLLRKNMIRLVQEDDGLSIYHSAENSRVYHERPAQSIEIDTDLGLAVEFLINSYPAYVTVDSLPCETDDLKFSIAELMFENGLLLMSAPFSRREKLSKKKKQRLNSNSSSTSLRIEKSTSF